MKAGGGEGPVNERSQYPGRRAVRVRAGDVVLDGILRLPPGAAALVIFAHGSGSSRLSPRNNFVADELAAAGLASLLFDLLTPEEEEIDRRTRGLRFDIDFLTERLVGATAWVREEPELAGLRIGYFGASTGAAAALWAAARLRDSVGAIVSRGGRPDLAMDALPAVRAPTLLIVGGNDEPVIEMNRAAYDRLDVEKEISIVPGATHLFEEPGTLETVARLAADWLSRHLV